MVPSALRAILSDQVDLNETHEQICQAVRDGDAGAGPGRPHYPLAERMAGLAEAYRKLEDELIKLCPPASRFHELEGEVTVVATGMVPGATVFMPVLAGRWGSRRLPRRHFGLAR